MALLAAGANAYCLQQRTACPAAKRQRRFAGRGSSLQATSQAVLSDGARTTPVDRLLYAALSGLAGFEPFLWVLRSAAFAVLTHTAEKQGVPWRRTVQQLQSDPEVYRLREEMTDPALEYPDYFRRAFHGYRQGNMTWQAAFEAEPATQVIAKRLYSEADPDLSPEACALKERQAYVCAVQEYLGSAHAVRHALDIGCGVGFSTRSIAQGFPEARVTGMDASPYFLAVAELRNRQQQREGRASSISYRHGLGERTHLPAASQDLVAVAFTYHELPQHIAAAVAAEARRLCRPGGAFVVVDLSPKSGVYAERNALAVLRNIVEPWHDAYFGLHLPAVLQQAGFSDVQTAIISPRHQAVMGRAL